jgi:alpha-D-ribose 1-methylphosphonate 5-triphosphate diphosphatase PhnM
MVALHASPHTSVVMSAQGFVQRDTLARCFCVVDMADHAPVNRQFAQQEVLMKYRRGLAGARVRVLKNLM